MCANENFACYNDISTIPVRQETLSVCLHFTFYSSTGTYTCTGRHGHGAGMGVSWYTSTGVDVSLIVV